jgi:hypothetical protein
MLNSRILQLSSLQMFLHLVGIQCLQAYKPLQTAQQMYLGVEPSAAVSYACCGSHNSRPQSTWLAAS